MRGGEWDINEEKLYFRAERCSMSPTRLLSSLLLLSHAMRCDNIYHLSIYYVHLFNDVELFKWMKFDSLSYFRSVKACFKKV